MQHAPHTQHDQTGILLRRLRTDESKRGPERPTAESASLKLCNSDIFMILELVTRHFYDCSSFRGHFHLKSISYSINRQSESREQLIVRNTERKKELQASRRSEKKRKSEKKSLLERSPSMDICKLTSSIRIDSSLFRFRLKNCGKHSLNLQNLTTIDPTHVNVSAFGHWPGRGVTATFLGNF